MELERLFFTLGPGSCLSQGEGASTGLILNPPQRGSSGNLVEDGARVPLLSFLSMSVISGAKRRSKAGSASLAYKIVIHGDSPKDTYLWFKV